MLKNIITLSLLLHTVHTSCFTRNDIKKAIYPAAKIALGCAYITMGGSALLAKPHVRNAIDYEIETLRDTHDQVKQVGPILEQLPKQFPKIHWMGGWVPRPMMDWENSDIQKIEVPELNLDAPLAYIKRKENFCHSLHTPTQYSLNIIGTTLFISGMLQIKEGYTALKKRFTPQTLQANATTTIHSN